MSGRRPRLLVTGGSGLLGGRVVALASKWFDTVSTHLTRPVAGGLRLDIRDATAVAHLCADMRPQIIIHTAYVKDDVEVIESGSANVAKAAAACGARLVHVSTDALFGGRKSWYREDDVPDPLTPYGKAKYAAEQAVVAACPAASLARTSLIYAMDGSDGHSRAILDGIRSGSRVMLFTDEFRCPVLVDDLARALVALAQAKHSGPLHLAGPERLSRFEFGALIARYHGADPSHLRASTIATEGVVRPRDCSLDSNRARNLLGIGLRGASQVLGAGIR